MKKIAKIICLILWMALIFYFSSQDGYNSNLQSNGLLKILFGQLIVKYPLLKILIRKTAHFFLYFVLGILSFVVSKDYKEKPFSLSLLICFIYACSDEIHQLFVPLRSGQIGDVLLDTAAALLSIFILSKLHNRK